MSLQRLYHEDSNFEMAISESKPRSHYEIGHRYILRAQFKEETCSLSLAYLAKKNKTPLSLVVIEGGVEESAVNCAKAWVEALMKAVYDGMLGSPSCRFLSANFLRHWFETFKEAYGLCKPLWWNGWCLSNYKVGLTLPTLFLFRKKARLYSQKRLNLYSRSQGVLLRFYVSSHSSLLKNTGVIFPDTSRQGEAHDVCQKLPLEFDAVITVSGDGLIHEVLNGFSKHADPLKALATPVAPIPTGSGNGLSLNLLGIEVMEPRC